jgi:hypothetical protein
MATKYINLEAAINEFDFQSSYYDAEWGAKRFATEDVQEILQSIPAADVQPVVTCEEWIWHVDDGCHNCTKLGMLCPDDADFYCKYGRRSNCRADMRGK